MSLVPEQTPPAPDSAAARQSRPGPKLLDSVADHTPATPPWVTYPSTVVRYRRADGAVAVQGSETTSDAFPWPEVCSVLSAWNPGGQPTTFADNLAHQDTLGRRVVSLGGVVTPASSHGADLSWAEQSLLVHGLHDPQVAALAAEFQQPAYLRWTAATLEVVTPDGVTRARSGWTSSPVSPKVCPMLSTPQPDTVCSMHGGPWTTGSRDAGVAWAVHRSLLLATIGCGVCADGSERVDTPGRPILLVELSCASRYSPPAVLRRLTDEELDFDDSDDSNEGGVQA